MERSQIRYATNVDAALIANMTQAAWAGTALSSLSGSHESIERVLEDLQLGSGLVLEVDGTPIGSVRWFPDPIANVWEIMRLGVLPAWRRQGWGAQLMEAVEHIAREAMVPELRLFVESGQPGLVAWYERISYQVGETPDYARVGTNTPPIMLHKLLS